jgi:hypothetical protein
MESPFLDPTHDDAELTHSEPLSTNPSRDVLLSLEAADSPAPGSHRQGAVVVAGVRSPLVNSGGAAAYAFGRRLNELRWRLELFPFTTSRHKDTTDIVRVAKELIPFLRRMIDDPAEARIERLILNNISDWAGFIHSEYYADDHIETFDRYMRLAAGEDLDEHFDDVSQTGERMAGEIRRAVLEVLEGGGQQAKLVQFGELIGQAVHPVGVAKHALREMPNRNYWREKYFERHPSNRPSPPERRVEEEEEEVDLKIEEEILSIIRKKKTRRGKKPTIGSVIPTLQDVAFKPEIWSTDVREGWGGLHIPARLPAAIRALFARPETTAIPALVKQIDDLVKQAFFRAIDSTETSRTLVADESQDHMVEGLRISGSVDSDNLIAEGKKTPLQKGKRKGKGQNDEAITYTILKHITTHGHEEPRISVSSIMGQAKIASSASVSKCDFYQRYLKKCLESDSRDPRLRNMPDSSFGLSSTGDAPSRQLEARELLEKLIRKYSHENEMALLLLDAKKSTPTPRLEAFRDRIMKRSNKARAIIMRMPASTLQTDLLERLKNGDLEAVELSLGSRADMDDED